tara:strand:+ start:141090 stop:143132 length:2043 start_codon:yes stop_codon:yes gene_type:complete
MTDKFLWLEEVLGKDALAWAEAQSKLTTGRIENDPRFAGLQADAEKIVTATDRLLTGSLMSDGYVWNFHQDGKKHVRGILRRCKLADYKKSNFKWETMLDMDKLAKKENENWVYSGSTFLLKHNRALVSMSKGGGDTVVIREYDFGKKKFIAPKKGGFYLPEAKSRYCWENEDTILVATDFGEGSLTDSGYPRVLKRVKRGQSLDEAETIGESTTEDMMIAPFVSNTPEGKVVGYTIMHTFYTSSTYLKTPVTGDDGLCIAETFNKLDIPEGATVQAYMGDSVLIELRSDMVTARTTYPQGSLVVVNRTTGRTRLLWKPTDTTALDYVTRVKSGFIVGLRDNVVNKVLLFSHDGSTWRRKTLPLPTKGIIGVFNTDAKRDTFMFTFSNALTPASLYWYDLASGRQTKLQSTPQRFDASGMELHQRFATSADGEQIPYFIMHKKGLKLNGSNPTMLYGYGGFEISVEPDYNSTNGKLWLENGGVYVIANIRGGGEFGPRWHQAALKHNRQRCYDDFIAVAEALIDTGVTSPRRLGIYGGSNGGLLVGAVMMQRPDLFNAVICAVPLLDMLRYHKLLAGASWMGEYGNPDIPEDRKVIETYSPYQNVKKDATYPEALFYTSTRDDRVHPGHARKMAAKLQSLGHATMYYENPEGGHSARANLKQAAYMSALQYVYLMQKLMD